MTKRINPGRQERAARKRHFRGSVWSSDMLPGQSPLKLGKKKFGIYCRKSALDWTSKHLPVTDSENNA